MEAPPASGAVSTDIVKGELFVDGKRTTLDECRPGRAVHTFVEVATPVGKLRLEDGRAYWHSHPKSPLRGDELSCEKLDRSWGGGTRTDGTSYWRGTIDLRCTAPVALKGRLELECGNITADERRQLDGNRKDFLDKQSGSQPP